MPCSALSRRVHLDLAFLIQAWAAHKLKSSALLCNILLHPYNGRGNHFLFSRLSGSCGSCLHKINLTKARRWRACLGEVGGSYWALPLFLSTLDQVTCEFKGASTWMFIPPCRCYQTGTPIGSPFSYQDTDTYTNTLAFALRMNYLILQRYAKVRSLPLSSARGRLCLDGTW